MSTIGGSYFLIILNDYSREIKIYVIAEKSEVSSVLKEYFSMIQTQFHKIFRSDNGIDFLCLK